MKKYKVKRNKSKKYKEYWLEQGYSEEDAIAKAKYEYSIRNPTTKLYWINLGYSEEDAKIKIRSKRNTSKEYWIAKGYSEEDAIKKANDIAKSKYKGSIQYWLEQGYSEENAKIISSEHNTGIKKAQEQFKRSQNRFCKEYWIAKGYSEEDAIKKAKEENKKTTSVITTEARHNTSVLVFKNMSLEQRNDINCRISKALKQKNKTHSPIFKEYWIAKGYSEEDAKKQVSVTKLSQIGSLSRASKIELKFFNELMSFLDINIFLQKWVHINKNNFCQDGRYKNTVIEFNGTAYHMDKRFYTINDVNPKGMSYIDVWKRNDLKISSYISKKYNIIVVWEYDYLNNKNKLFNKIKEIIGNEESYKEGNYWDSASFFN